MEKRKMKAADFAALVGTSPKTIYNLIKNQELLSVIEIQRGRKITFILSDDVQIADLQKRYGKDTSMKFQYYENETKFTENENTITDNENSRMVKNNNDTEIIDKVIELSKTYNETLLNYNEKLLNVQEQLLTEKSKIPLLEDKAAREGMYLKEINELKAAASDTIKQNNKKQRLFVAVLSVLFILWVITLGILIYNLLTPRTVTETIIKEVPKEVILKK